MSRSIVKELLAKGLAKQKTADAVPEQFHNAA
jgi:hypothetical protein